MNQQCGRVATVIGRYFALDRDKRWSRVEPAYRLITLGEAEHHAGSAREALYAAYERGESDEFVQATRIGVAEPIGENDSIIFMNFRPDRARQLCEALISPSFGAFPRPQVIAKNRLLTLTQYSDDLDGPCAFPRKRSATALVSSWQGSGRLN